MPVPHAVTRAEDALRQSGDGEPVPWAEVLEGFRHCVGGDSARLLAYGGAGELLALQRQGGDAAADRDYVEHFHASDIMLPLGRGSGRGAWADSAQAFGPEQLQRNVFYVDFLCRHRMRQLVAYTALDGPAHAVALSVQSATVQAATRQRLDSSTTRRFTAVLDEVLAQRQARALRAWAVLEGAFSGYGEPLLLVTPGATVLQLSALARDWLGRRTRLALRGGRLYHPDARVQTALLDGLRRAVAGHAPLTLAVPGGQGHVDRLELSRADERMSLCGERLALVRLRRRPADAAPPELLTLAYGLTPAEARVLAALLAGQQPKRYAAEHGVALTTVRTQIAALLVKMACARQSDLVREAARFL